LNIEWYNFERIKQYGKNWEHMYVWANSVVGYNLIKKMDPSLNEFTRKLEDSKLTEMIEEFHKLSSGTFEVAENEFLKTYLAMQGEHADKMKEIPLQEKTTSLYGEHFGEKLQAYHISALQE